MELRRKSRMSSEVSTSSLNDIMFFLMLFFLIMSTMVAPSVIKINLPKTKKKIKIIHPIEIWVCMFLYLYFSMYNVNAAGFGDWNKPKPPSPPPIQSPKPSR